MLKTSEYNKELLGLLGYKSVLEKDEYKNNFPEINLEINRMLLEFITWITPELDKNEYITICW